MFNVGDKLLVEVEVKSLTISAKGIEYRVYPLGKDRYSGLDIIESDVHAKLREDYEGGKKK